MDPRIEVIEGDITKVEVDAFLTASGEAIDRVLVITFGGDAHRKCLVVSQSLAREQNRA